MRNSSQKAGCMRRLPASHSCHPRSVQWMRAAAAVCESPAASRAARTCSGNGFAAGPFGPRFGWLGISNRLVKVASDDIDVARQVVHIESGDFFRAHEVCQETEFDAGAIIGNTLAVEFAVVPVRTLVLNRPFRGFGVAGIGDFATVANVDELCGGHFRLLPLFLPRRGGLRCATHELNYTRIACNSKKYFREIAEAEISPHNAGDKQ